MSNRTKKLPILNELYFFPKPKSPAVYVYPYFFKPIKNDIVDLDGWPSNPKPWCVFDCKKHNLNNEFGIRMVASCLMFLCEFPLSVENVMVDGLVAAACGGIPGVKGQDRVLGLSNRVRLTSKLRNEFITNKKRLNGYKALLIGDLPLGSVETVWIYEMDANYIVSCNI